MGPTIPIKDPEGRLAKALEYQRWVSTSHDRHHNYPVLYWFILAHPENFKKAREEFEQAREEFELHWAIKRLTR